MLSSLPIQPKPEQVDLDEIREKLFSGTIVKEIASLKQSRNKNGYIVLLDNGLFAVFKQRSSYGAKNEVMAFHMAHDLLGVKYVIPCAVPKTYLGMQGILQHFIPTDLSLDDTAKDFFYKLRQLYSKMDACSYQDMQVVKYLLSVDDVNSAGYIPWKNSKDQFMLTYVDCEFIMGKSVRYGQTSFGDVDVTNYSATSIHHALLSEWTSRYNADTMVSIEKLTKEKVREFWQQHGYSLDEDQLEGFMRRRNYLLTAYKATLNQTVVNTSSVNRSDTSSPLFSP